MSKTEIICGMDEAGRGALAGPVCAAAVILSDDFALDTLDDSKKLSEAKREAAALLIREQALAWGIGWAAHNEIDTINILRASLLAMKRAFELMLENITAAKYQSGLQTLTRVDFIKKITGIADGLYIPDITIPCRALIKADSLIPSVMAASILAKTARDAEMIRLEKQYPEYKYSKHKGYPTREHKDLLVQFGPSPIQRTSFKWHL
ncbi:MAG: ribonuclease HII [Spirochaetaceae bacterium]|jgi:ribonuclease HII|nr:ribonuclease HII [Spirochaetaceae bacterium]